MKKYSQNFTLDNSNKIISLNYIKLEVLIKHAYCLIKDNLFKKNFVILLIARIYSF